MTRRSGGTSRRRALGRAKIIATHGFRNIYPRSFREHNSNPATDTGEQYYTWYTTPSTELGDHRASGGFFRDKPPPADVLPAGTSQDAAFLHDAKQDIAEMIAAGFNAEFVDLLDVTAGLNTRPWRLTRIGLQAAQAVDPAFKVFPMPDYTGGGPDAATLTAALLDFASYPSAGRVESGRLLVAPFTPETQPVSFWQDVAARMAAAGEPVAWLWCLQKWTEKRLAGDALTVFQTYSAMPDTYGMTTWGSRNPLNIASEASRATDTRNTGLRWFAPIAPQDQRYSQGIYDENVGTQLLRDGWANARAAGAVGVQGITWRDLSESTHFATSAGNLDGWQRINRFYVNWFKAGVAPTAARDFVALVHRKQHTATAQTYAQTTTLSLRANSTPTTNIVEVFSWLKAPAQIVATIGGTAQPSYDAPAGEFIKTFPISTTTTGAPSVAVSRSGSQVLALTSRHSITTAPFTQDFTYYVTHADGS